MAEKRQQYDPLTNAAWHFLTHLDKFHEDHSQDHPTMWSDTLFWEWDFQRGKPLLATTASRFNEFMHDHIEWATLSREMATRPRQIARISKGMFDDHLHRGRRLYTCGHARSTIQRLLIDIDGKHPGQKPDAVLAELLRLLPEGVYYEPSCGGKGYHAHLMVQVPSANRKPWDPGINDVTNRLAAALRHHMNARLGPNSGFDRILGHCPILTFKPLYVLDTKVRSYPQVKQLGTAAMLPRFVRGCTNPDAPMLLEDMDYDFYHKYVAEHLYDPRVQCLASWITAPVMEWSYLPELLKDVEESCDSEAPNSGYQCVSPHRPTAQAPNGGYTFVAVSVSDDHSSTSSRDHNGPFHPCIGHPDGNIHKLGVYSVYRRLVGDDRTFEGYEAFYHTEGHVRNPDKPLKARLRELSRAWTWGEENYREMHERFSSGDYSFVDYSRKLERQFIQGRRVPPELVRVVVFLAEHPTSTNFHSGFTVGLERIKALCRRLYADKVIRRLYTDHRVLGAAKSLACHMGWLQQIDDHQHVVKGKGVAEKFIPGLAHPRFAGWIAEYGTMASHATDRIRALQLRREERRRAGRAAG